MLNRGMEKTKVEMKIIMSEMRISWMGWIQYYTLWRKISELEDTAIGTPKMNHTKEAERKLKLSTNKLKSNLRQLNVCVIKLPEKRREMREIQMISEMLTTWVNIKIGEGYFSSLLDYCRVHQLQVKDAVKPHRTGGNRDSLLGARTKRHNKELQS